MRKPMILLIPLLGLATPYLAVAAESEPSPNPLGFEPNTAFWVLAIFVILAIILYKMAWKNVLTGLKTRENRIRGDISNAESLRLKAEATLRQYEDQLASAQAKVQEMLNQATVQAHRLADQMRIGAQAEAEQIRERTLKEIDEAKHQAVAEIYDQAAGLATSVAEKILRRNLNADDQKDLVKSSLDQMGKVSRN
jgi:F-type H+-transporting ATPase subunit b